MLAASTLLTSVIVFWLLASIAVAIAGRKVNHSFPSIALFVGGVALVAAACVGWNSNSVWAIPTPFYLSIMPFSNRIDSLSSIFVGLLGSVTIAISLYSPGYLNQPEKLPNASLYWVELFIFATGMLGVILGANALSFLVWGEIMTLSSLLLISTNFTSPESRRASFIYLGATRIATALLIAGFIWMHVLTKSWEFSEWNFSGHETLAPALMIFLGLSIKAGIWPSQAWLPRAHQGAPAPVAALMSGVMLETSLYAILRILIMGGLVSPYIAYLMLGLGLISAFWGILLAFIQRDLKVMLAYSTIENVGLIFVSLGVAVLGASVQLPVVSSLGIAGAVYHCVNHGFFKSLLFLGAGAIDSQAHTVDLNKCGGLGRAMPWTMTGFVIGSAAICSLPPLNGFNSSWLVYQGLFQLANLSSSVWLGGLSIFCIGVLGLVSALTIATFARATGMAFLGRPRSHLVESAVEVSLGRSIAQGLMAVLCVAFGLSAPIVLGLIKPICLAARTGGLVIFPIPMGVFALGIGLFTACLHFFWLNGDKSSVEIVDISEGGPGHPARAQATLDGFSENVAHTFVRLNPEFESSIYRPIVRSITWLGERMLFLQSGSVHLYLVYMLVTLVALMLAGMLT